MLTYHIKPEPDQKRLLLLDQRLLPVQEQYFICRRAEDAVYAIREMVVRGAPAIGVTAAWGCWLAALQLQMDGLDKSKYWERLLMESLQKIAQARPTAVNLAWAVTRMRKVWMDNSPVNLEELIGIWENEAENIHADDIELNMRMGAHGAELIADGDTVMTHCNAGSLATAGYGTALGVIYSAVEAGKNIKVISNETRPWLQGARLTAFELQKSGVDVTVACDNSCAILMSKGLVQKVVVGADRVAANGDAANKIGTYGVAVLAKHFGIPFYIAAPYSTFDFNCPAGKDIPIEERPHEEVTRFRDAQIAPAGVPAYNFSFDVTPAALITGFITEHGVFKPPYFRSFRKLQEKVQDELAKRAAELAAPVAGACGVEHPGGEFDDRYGFEAAAPERGSGRRSGHIADRTDDRAGGQGNGQVDFPADGRADGEPGEGGVILSGADYPIGKPAPVTPAWLEDSAAEVASLISAEPELAPDRAEVDPDAVSQNAVNQGTVNPDKAGCE